MPRQSAVMQGLKELDKRLKTLDFMQAPAKQFLREWREDVKQYAQEFAPEWKGDILDSIRSAQDTKRFPIWARVYSDSKHARWADLGTGIFSTDPNSAKQAYFPSVEGVREWAESKGMDPFGLALGIYRAGGTKGSHFFEQAAEKANLHRGELMSRFSTEIQREAARK